MVFYLDTTTPKNVENCTELAPCLILDMNNGRPWFVERREMNTMNESKHPIANVLRHGVTWNMKPQWYVDR